MGIGLIVNGRPVHGMMHPEGGHVSVPIHPEDEKNKFKGVCIFHGNCLEGLVSNVSIKERLGLESVDRVKELEDNH